MLIEKNKNKLINDLTIKHNAEVKILQDSKSNSLKMLSKEKIQFLEESFTLLKNERDRLNTIHEQKLVTIEKQYESETKQQKIINENELAFYKEQIKKQAELSKY